MCEQTEHTFVLNDHDIGFSENPKNLGTNLIALHGQDPWTAYNPAALGPTAPPFMAERMRRMEVNAMYAALRILIPKSTQNDRASVVKGAINYIKELTRTVQDLKSLVKGKRDDGNVIGIKKQKLISSTNDSPDTKTFAEFSDKDDHNHGSNSRSSWLGRKSKDTEVFVWVIGDEVAVKLVQRNDINLLLLASKLLDQLQLDIRHVNSFKGGDRHSLLFKTMISQGSSLCAKDIANKLIEALDIHHATISRL